MNFDPDVRQILSNHLKMVFADERGHVLAGPGPGVVRYAVLGPVPLPITLHGRTCRFQWYTFARYPVGEGPDSAAADVILHRLSASDDLPNSVLVMGDLARADAPLVRVHSCCATGDIFGSQRCECGPQLRRAQQMVADEGAGAIVYLSDHEGRGIGLFAKAAAYLLQDNGFDTYEANRKLGFPDDCRNFGEAAFIIHHLRGEGRPIRLISNNPDKRRALEAGGVEVKSLVPLILGLTPHNRRYLQTKRAYGHLFTDDDLEPVDAQSEDEAKSHKPVSVSAMGL
jgi:GTP cyclohydrolase II